DLPPLEIPELPPSIISASLAVNHAPPAWNDVEEACQQIKFMSIDCDVPEALWYNGLGVAAYTDNPEAAAIAWSRNYHSYSETATLRKMAQWTTSTTGPATCQKFKDLNPEGCQGCKYQVKTPIQAVKIH